MRIQESNVRLSASHESTSQRSFETVPAAGFREVLHGLSEPGEDSVEALRQRVAKLLQSLIDTILAAAGGKQCRENIAAEPPPANASPAEAGIGRTLSIVQTVRTSEKTNFCGEGCVRTADGREISFDFSFNRQRDETQTLSLGGEPLRLRDPLMLSFDGKAAELTGRRIAFDLDADGKAEQIPGIGAGCGFLVFDRNGNGRADDGRELFGVASGKGFAELAALDADRNGWVDENDPAYSHLGVWTADGYATLAQKGVGALYTGSVDTPFTLTAEEHELLAQIRASGIYLSESGRVGALQQVDLAVSDRSPGKEKPEQGERLRA